MKKIIFTLLALVGTMSMNAQVMKVMKNGEVVATYTADQADEVLFEEAPAAPAAPTTGTAMATIGRITKQINWVQLWAGGPKFAEFNVGVTNGKAESYGGYYNWGKTTSKDKSEDFKSGTDALTGTDDTATALWGENWRMPTKEEFDALLANCDVAWTDDYNGDNTNIAGMIFTGKGVYKDNSIFLPAAGDYLVGEPYSTGAGIYWSSTPDNDNQENIGAFILSFTSIVQGVGSDFRFLGHSVRAVLAE